ncbi:CBO0543 family protein [Aquibacillus koreensis]|uniref:CBO0543 family protein n=1 Tax=Aquibacillus koreensis TaxID=279446 RepID=UPI003898DA56
MRYLCLRIYRKLKYMLRLFFALFFGKTVDELLDLKKNWYGYIGNGVQYSGVLAQLIIYPTVNLLFLNYFPFAKTTKSKLLYIIGWSLFSITFERLCLKTKFFYYKNWKSVYSTILYPFLFLTLVYNLRLVRFLLRMYSK